MKLTRWISNSNEAIESFIKPQHVGNALADRLASQVIVVEKLSKSHKQTYVT